jgi:hypothetical protein
LKVDVAIYVVFSGAFWRKLPNLCNRVTLIDDIVDNLERFYKLLPNVASDRISRLYYELKQKMGNKLPPMLLMIAGALREIPLARRTRTMS